MRVVPVILCGGSGTRLWPLSRRGLPKQFLTLFSEKSLFQETILRLSSLKAVNISEPVIICNQEHNFLVQDQLDDIDITNRTIILEPVGRNTAPAITLAALEIEKRAEIGDLMLVLPSDHLINNEALFSETVMHAIRNKLEGSIITFGVKPSMPHSGYGYIKTELLENHKSKNIASEFIEKPDLDRASQFYKSGEYLWNSGIFLFETKSYLESIRRSSPMMFEACFKSHSSAVSKDKIIKLELESFASSPSVSIDNEVLEKAIQANTDIQVFLLDVGWSDVGSWTSLLEEKQKDKEGNSLEGDVISIDTSNSLLHSEKGLLVVAGLKDIIAVQTADVVLVSSKEKSQELSNIIKNIEKETAREEFESHKKTNRPWGHFELLHDSEECKIKILKVNPKQKLSLQKHKHRDEHWVVIEGVATVTIGESAHTLEKNQSIKILRETKHSLENLEDVDLLVLEMQTGDYFGEDDIIRYEDRYGRML